MQYTLKVGDQGAVVKALQNKLCIPADGVFGPQTRRAVLNYQEQHGLTPDGVAGIAVLGDLAPQLGVDLSHNNQAVNWDLLASMTDWVAIKLTEGQNWLDPKAYALTAAARQHHIGTLLGYHFATPDHTQDDPLKEAKFYWEHAQATGVQRHVLDLEANKGLDTAELIAWADTWLTQIAAWSGTTPILYTGSAYVRYTLGGGGRLTRFPLWIARYWGESKRDPGPIGDWSDWYGWQFTGSGSIPAVKGSVDLSWIRKL